jgi:hypothetical protein
MGQRLDLGWRKEIKGNWRKSGEKFLIDQWDPKALPNVWEPRAGQASQNGTHQIFSFKKQQIWKVGHSGLSVTLTNVVTHTLPHSIGLGDYTHTWCLFANLCDQEALQPTDHLPVQSTSPLSGNSKTSVTKICLPNTHHSSLSCKSHFMKHMWWW